MLRVVAFAQPNKTLKDSMFQKGDIIAIPPIYYGLSHPLGKETIDSLNVVGAFLAQHKDLTVEISCHTDSRGTDTFNLKLTNFRAKHIQSYLVDQFKLDTNFVKCKGYGEGKPIIPDSIIKKAKTKEEMENLYAINRRTEMIVLDAPENIEAVDPNYIEEINFSKELYAQTIFETISLYDSSFKVLNKEEVFSKFYGIAIGTLCHGWNGEFRNANYMGEEQLSTWKFENIFDTITNDSDPDFLKFMHIIRSEAGEYLGKTKFAFQVKKKDVLSLNKVNLPALPNSKLVTGPTKAWKIKKMLIYNDAVQIDSCVKEYVLNLYNDQTFEQNYGKDWGCVSTLTPETKKKLKLIQDTISHEIDLKNGYWKTDNDKLYFIDKEGKNILIYTYKLKGKRLTLIYENYMELQLKRQKL